MSTTYMPFGFGLQRVIDAQMRYIRSTLPVYLRLKNFPDVMGTQWSQLGFNISPSGAPVGTTDVLIDPCPSTAMVSVHNIGQSAGKLRFGARVFMVSGSFVDKQAKARNFSILRKVWEDELVVGLFTDNLLFSIEDIAHREVAGKSIIWKLVCNCNNLK